MQPRQTEVRQHDRHLQLAGVRIKSSVALLAIPEVHLDHSEHMLDLRPDARPRALEATGP